MAFSLKHIPKWNALEIKQNGKNSSNVHDRFERYISSLPQIQQVDNWTYYIPDTEYKRWMSMFSGLTTMTQTEASILGTEKPIIPEIEYKLKHKDKMKLPPYPFQEVGANFLVDKERGLIGDEMGLGKSQPLTSLVATPTGWVEMGDVRAGDIIMGVDGKSQKVINAYPQGLEDVYDITFNDGSVGRSSLDHYWNVQTPRNRYNQDNSWQTLELNEIKENLKDKSERYRMYIPTAAPMQYEEAPVLIEPYLMGYMLGNGIFKDDEFVIVSIKSDEQQQLLEEILADDIVIYKHEDYTERYILVEEGGYLFDATIEYGLNGLGADELFIPKDYLFASHEQRLALLQGLMDASGHSPGSKVAEHSTLSEQLSRDIVELVQSMGGRGKTFVSRTSEDRDLYRLTITVPTGVEVFRLPRKLEKQPLERKYQFDRSIVSIEYSGKEETQCIEVENKDGLYLTNNYIVTHNTMSALTAFNELHHEGKAKKALLVVPASLKFQWEEEIRKFTNFLAIVIDGTKKQRTEQYDNFEIGLDSFAIISYETMRNDIKIVKDLPFEVVVVDEAHRLKNRQTKLYKAFEQLESNYLFMLTGTPMQNKLDELFALFKLINEDILGGVTKFKKSHYIVGEKFGRRFIELGYKNLDAVREKTSPYIMRRTKKEVAPDLPERVYSKVYVDMGKAQADLYKEIEDSFKALQNEIGDFYESQSEADARAGKKHKSEDMILGYLYMLQAVSNHPLQLAKSDSQMARAYMPFIRKAQNSAKLDELLEILRPLMEEGSKVVIFSQYVSMLEIIYNHIFTEFGFYPYVIHGGIKAKQRTEAVSEFSDHPLRNIMLLSDAGNYGLVI